MGLVRLSYWPDKGGFAYGKLLGLLIAVSIVGGGIWAGKNFLNREEEKFLQEKYHTAKKLDFHVTAKLTGTLVPVDEVVLKSELEGHSTIRYVIEEGEDVTGNYDYTIQPADTLESVAEATGKHMLNIKVLNDQLSKEKTKGTSKRVQLDWDNLEPGTTITIPGDLLVELDPLDLKARINRMDIVVRKSENALARIKGNFETVQLSADLELKRAENNHANAVNQLEKVRNSEVKNYIDNVEGVIANLEEEVALAEKNLEAYTGLRKLGFVSDVEVLREQAKRNKALHNIKMTKADLAAYKKYDKETLISIKQLDAEEALVNIKKTQVKNAADLTDANSSIITQEKTLALEKEQLEDLREQMSNTRIYAPKPGTVVYYAPPHWEKREPVDSGASVRRGHNIIKLPKDKALKVDLSIPQAMHKQLRPRSTMDRAKKAWVQVDGGEPIPGTLTLLSDTVDSKRRGHTQQSYFKGEVTLDRTDFPDSVSVGMSVKVEIQVKNLVGKHRLIKIPNQCITSKIISKNVSQRGCFVLNPVTEKPEWRPVDIAYIDEVHSAIKSEVDPGRGLREGELVHLSPLTQAESLNLEEGVTNKGKVKLGDPKLEEDEDKEDAGG
ncbi:MAG: HlyD family efflux transporter periplasmic adaptor subunit [Verrucomicrobiota bacterium]|jgi:multidrug efflux pump subunit AcrA (membrane-fusion protein)|nr:HlyD family efflux transporter periplasmic adaptor subunit [Verrucomicrobiota bacterium]